MTEPKKTEYLVINLDDDQVIYRTESIDKAEGYAECMREQCEVKCLVSQIVRV